MAIKNMQDFLDLELKNKKNNFFLTNALYVVSTPIGNMSDITLRAIDSLKKCDLVVCEDSRISSRLLKYLEIKKPLITYNDQSNEDVRLKIMDLIKNQGKSLCLISDAGTPLISDPGYKLVNFLINNGVEIKSVPGPCSAIAALSISGIQSDRFLFAGFIPNIKSQKENFLKDLVGINATLIFFESAQRIVATLKQMLIIFGNRRASVAREITKIYEEVKTDRLENLIEFYGASKVKGEIVILISKPDSKIGEVDLGKVDKELTIALENNIRPKDAVNLVADNCGLNKKIVYQRMLEITNKNDKKK